MAAALVSGRPRIGLAEIGHPSGTFRGWTGIGPLTYDGYTWTGMGVLGRVTPLKRTSALEIQDIVFELSGVDSDALARLSGSVKGYVGKLWLACLDPNERVIADPYLLCESELDVQDFEAAEDGTCTIRITGHTGFYSFERELNEVWSPENQRKRFPGDTGLDMLPELENQDLGWTAT